MIEDQIFLNKYRIQKELGSGGFGKVYEAQNIKTNKRVAIKVDTKSKGAVVSEAKVLECLQGEGIPKLIDFGKSEDTHYMIIQLLGRNLSSIQKECSGKFSLATTLTVGLQVLSRLELIHSRGFIHRDLKPQQVIESTNKKKLYLVDFGLAKRYILHTQHIPLQNNCQRAGNSSFTSLNNHMGIRQSRRDDIESWAYMLVYMIKGKLPWQIYGKKNTLSKWQKVFVAKTSIRVEELCENCPREFIHIINYCRTIRYEEKPDYDYLKSILSGIRLRNNLQEGYLEWCMSEDKMFIPKRTIKRASTEKKLRTESHSKIRTKKSTCIESNTQERLPNPQPQHLRVKVQKSATLLSTNNSFCLSTGINTMDCSDAGNHYKSFQVKKDLVIKDCSYSGDSDQLEETTPAKMPEIKDRSILRHLKPEREPTPTPQSAEETKCLLF